MKKAIFTLCFGLCACFLFAQAPQKFNYQAVARNAQGALLLNQNIKIRASILTGSANGTSQYSETHSVTTNAQTGLFSISIGDGTIVGGSGAFSAITWASGTKYLKIEMDPAGGNNFTLVGTSQLLSVPYALYAGQSPISNTKAFQTTDISPTDRLVTVPVPSVQVTAPESGTYLVLASLYGESFASSDGSLTAKVVKLISGTTTQIFNFVVGAKANGEVLPAAESSNWTIATLAKNDVLRLDYLMSSYATPPSTTPFKIGKGKLILIKMN